MKRWILTAAVVIAALVIYVLTRSGEEAPVASPVEEPGAAAVPSTTTTTTSTTTTTTTVKAPEADEVPTTRAYVLEDGTRVRDHRTGVTEKFDIPSTPPQRKAERLAQPEVAKVHAALHPMAMECAKAVPDAELASDAVLQIRMLVHVADGSLVADSVTARSRGLGSKTADVEACVRERAASIAVDVAADHPSVEAYPLTFPYRVRR
jgi:hypothetical protein